MTTEMAERSTQGRVPARQRERAATKRTKQLQLRLSEGEHAAITEAARASGMSRGAWAAATVQASIDRHRDPLESVELRAALGELVEARAELARVGNNLNQLARRANEGTPPAVSLIEDMRDELFAVLAEIGDVTAEVGSAARRKR